MQLVGALQFYTDSQGVLYAADPTTGQPYVIGQAGGSIPAAGIVTEAPTDGGIYGRQNAAWTTMQAPWTECTYPAGCSGPLYARKMVGEKISSLQLIGEASSVANWDGSYSFILAYLPPGLAPATDRYVLVPSSNGPSLPNSISCAWIKPTGELALAFIYSKGPNPLMAWFDGVEFLMATN